MSDLNTISLIGRLTKDPESFSDGKVTKFSIANSYYDYKSKDNATNFFNCVAFGKSAETIMTYLRKGGQVAIQGELRQSKWQGKDGSNRYSTDVIVNNFQMLAKPKSDSEQEGSSSRGAQPEMPLEKSSNDYRENPGDEDVPF